MIKLPRFSISLFCAASVGLGGLCTVAAMGAKTTQILLPQTAKIAAKYTVMDTNGVPQQKARIYPVRFVDQVQISGGGSRWVNPPFLTDARGRFTLTDATIKQIIVLPAATKSEPKPSPFFAPVGKNSPIQIVCPQSVPFRVGFVDGDNKPIAQKAVMVFPVDAANAKNTEDMQTTAFVVDGGFPGTPPELAAAFTAKTNDSGEAFFPALPKNTRVSLTIDAQPDVRHPLCLAGSVLLRPPLAHFAPLTIRLPFSGEITGQILRKSTGKPVAHARVHLQEPGPTGGVRAFGPQTDAEGRFRFTGLYPATYHLEFDGFGVSPTEREKSVRYLQTEPAEVTLKAAPNNQNTMRAMQNVLLAQAGQVNVTVRDTKGRPLFAQEVTLNSARGGGGGYTDLNGKIILRDLPGLYKIVWTNSDDHSPGRTIAEQTITLGEGKTQTVTMGAAPKINVNVDGTPILPFAPDFIAHDANGKSVRLSSFRGKTVVLDFVYLDEAPAPGTEATTANLGALRAAEKTARALQSNENGRVVFLAVCSGANGAEKHGWLTRALGKRKQAFPHVLFLQEAWGDPRLPAKIPSAMAAFHMDGWPQRFIIGADGTLRNAYGASDYSGHGFDDAGINDAALLLRAIRAALLIKSDYNKSTKFVSKVTPP